MPETHRRPAGFEEGSRPASSTTFLSMPDVCVKCLTATATIVVIPVKNPENTVALCDSDFRRFAHLVVERGFPPGVH